MASSVVTPPSLIKYSSAIVLPFITSSEQGSFSFVSAVAASALDVVPKAVAVILREAQRCPKESAAAAEAGGGGY